MNDNVKLWIDALRSGKYKQTRNTLGGSETGYCCLGVACAVYEEQTQNVLPKVEAPDSHSLMYNEGSLSGDYNVVREWLDLGSSLGSNMIVDENGDTFTLAHANDVMELSFSEIADKIEAYYENN